MLGHVVTPPLYGQADMGVWGGSMLGQTADKGFAVGCMLAPTTAPLWPKYMAPKD